MIEPFEVLEVVGSADEEDGVDGEEYEDVGVHLFLLQYLHLPLTETAKIKNNFQLGNHIKLVLNRKLKTIRKFS